ncbi:MAG: hypothetical protein Q9209_002175 [Squamulea sp. 1 TL-2023]
MDLPNSEPKKKRMRLLKAAQSGTWKEFLDEAASVTQKAFRIWFSEEYLKSAPGARLPKHIKVQINGICNSRSVRSIDRAGLLPRTVEVFEAWEALPLVPQTRQWAIARARMIGWLLINGLFRESLTQGLNFTKQELDEARLWLHKKRNGTVSIFQPSRLPWHHKDLFWINDSDEGGFFKTIVQVPADEPGADVKSAEGDHDNPEALRISSQTLQQMMETPIIPDVGSIEHTAQGDTAVNVQSLPNPGNKTGNDSGEPGQHPPSPLSRDSSFATHKGQTSLKRTHSDVHAIDQTTKATRSIGRTQSLASVVTEEAENIPEGSTFRNTHRILSAEQKAERQRIAATSAGLDHSRGSDNFRGGEDKASIRAQKLRQHEHNVRHTQSNNEDSLFVSEDEVDNFYTRVKMEETPWNVNAQNRARFNQSPIDDIGGSSSGVHFKEHMNGDDDTNTAGSVHVGHARRSAPSMSFPLSRGAEFQYAGGDMETEPASYVVDPNMTLGELMAFRDQENRKRLSHDGTGESEATTEILDSYDAEISVPGGGGFYKEMDKENGPISGATNSLQNDGEDRLEVRVIKDEDPFEDELAADLYTDSTIEWKSEP